MRQAVTEPRWGFLAIDKPLRKSSRQVVDRVSRVFGEKRIGHAGTLDPNATGVLLLAIGPATRLIGFAQAQSKEYIGTFQLGITSDSHDLETPCRSVANACVPDRAAIELAATRFVGWIQQTPPAFSAVKVDGRRAYKLARAGRPVALKPRPVHIDSLEILDYQYPALRLAIRCGRGTYVRSLGRDLAAALGTDCVMTELRRMAVGTIRVEQSCRLEDVSCANWSRYRLDPQQFLCDVPRLECDAAQLAAIRCGKGLAVGGDVAGEWLAAYDGDRRLLAMLSRGGGEGLWKPTMNFVPFWDQADSR